MCGRMSREGILNGGKEGWIPEERDGQENSHILLNSGATLYSTLQKSTSIYHKVILNLASVPL